MIRILIATLFVSLALPGALCAQNQGALRAENHEAESLTLRDLDRVALRLQSDDPDELRTAIDQLTEIDHADVVPHLVELLHSGPPDPVTDRALVALKQLHDRAAIDVLIEFTGHRRSGARRRAYQALAAIQDSRIPGVLEQGLRDSDRSVRSTAAMALGNIDARESVDILFRAFERGVIEAGISIGKLGTASHLERFHEHLGVKPLSVMLSGYDQFLRRSDLRDPIKTDIITRLGEVSGPMVRRFLEQYLHYLGTVRDRRHRALRSTVEETLRRIPEEA